MKNTVLPPNEGTAIVINRMYVGDYLSSNLGHEVINMYTADNGNHYLYLNATGDFVKAHQGKIGYMLLAKYHGVGEVEIIGMACGLQDVYHAEQKIVGRYEGVDENVFKQQQKFVEEEGGISYGGASIFDIFSESEQQSIFITYKASKVYTPKKEKRLFIRFLSSSNPKHSKSDIIVQLAGYQQAKASLKQYIYAEGTYPGDLTKQNVEAKKKDYCKIREDLIDNMSLWEESNIKVGDKEVNKVNGRKISLFDICRIQNDENKFSNALSYFMLCYRKLWRDFFIRYGIDLGDCYSVTREEASKIEDDKYNQKYPSGGRIDLMIRTNNDLIVIENKIKSDINSIEEDGEGKQLRRYYNYVTWLSLKQDYKKTLHFFILTPRYNEPTIEDAEMKQLYKVITYADIYDYLTDKYDEIKNDPNFVAFYEAMKRHTHENVNDYLYYEMQEKLMRRIYEYHQNKKTFY